MLGTWGQISRIISCSSGKMLERGMRYPNQLLPDVDNSPSITGIWFAIFLSAVVMRYWEGELAYLQYVCSSGSGQL